MQWILICYSIHSGGDVTIPTGWQPDNHETRPIELGFSNRLAVDLAKICPRFQLSTLANSYVFSNQFYGKKSEVDTVKQELYSVLIRALHNYLHVGPEISATTWRVMCTASYLFREKANNGGA